MCKWQCMRFDRRDGRFLTSWTMTLKGEGASDAYRAWWAAQEGQGVHVRTEVYPA